ncbi:MAG: YbhB/YbcL family Raf kinase inhibitor-like protein, partial [Rhodospirillales bacterium]|nr:YbhB/YbcL family Raf kinase inhibitor-like protein [Rhodospirillales bacterium]
MTQASFRLNTPMALGIGDSVTIGREGNIDVRLISSAFAPGERIPVRFTCEGEDISPPLAWFDPPERTRSFALICSDPDAPGGVWYHWAIYDIPPEMQDLAE